MKKISSSKEISIRTAIEPAPNSTGFHDLNITGISTRILKSKSSLVGDNLLY